MTDTIEQAARVIYEASCRAVSNWPPRYPWDDLTDDDRERFLATAQALSDAGLLVSGEPVAWLYRLNFPEEETAWDWDVSIEKMTDERFGPHGGVLENRPLYALPSPPEEGR